MGYSKQEGRYSVLKSGFPVKLHVNRLKHKVLCEANFVNMLF